MVETTRSKELQIKSRLRALHRRKRNKAFLFAFLFILCIILAVSYEVLAKEPKASIRLTMVYSSEKRGWIEEVTPLFLSWWKETYPDVPIEIHFSALGSRESMIQIITGEIKPVVWSPASSVWVPLVNWMWSEEYEGVLVQEYSPLVLSPIVIATWEEYAAENNITDFQTLHSMAIMPDTDLRIAHTDPQLSNSGFMSVIMEVSVASNKTPESLTPDDLLSNDVWKWLTELESKVVHYGKSTGFLVDEAIEVGPNGLNVLIIYENLVIEKNLVGEPLVRWGQKLVAVYPEEGTLLSDHPLCILNAPWINERERWAAEELQRFLLRQDTQAKAVNHGLRPTNPNVSLDESIFSPNYGVSYDLSIPTLSPPSDGEVLWHITDIWFATRARG
jgi:Ca-activated chloride channel family protein